MIGSFSMSFCNFLTSLILSHQEIPVEYRLMTCLPRVFPVFLPFSISSPCLYSTNVLLMTSSLGLTLPYVHLCPNLPLSMRPFNYSCFLCYSIPSFGVSPISLKNSLSFNISSTIIFIKYRNHQHMKNNIR